MNPRGVVFDISIVPVVIKLTVLIVKGLYL